MKTLKLSVFNFFFLKEKERDRQAGIGRRFKEAPVPPPFFVSCVDNKLFRN